jgi:hypothetical protein
MLNDAALWRDLRSFKNDWARWSPGERLTAAVSTFAMMTAAVVMLLNGF